MTKIEKPVDLRPVPAQAPRQLRLGHPLSTRRTIELDLGYRKAAVGEPTVDAARVRPRMALGFPRAEKSWPQAPPRLHRRPCALHLQHPLRRSLPPARSGQVTRRVPLSSGVRTIVHMESLQRKQLIESQILFDFVDEKLARRHDYNTNVVFRARRTSLVTSARSPSAISPYADLPHSSRSLRLAVAHPRGRGAVPAVAPAYSKIVPDYQLMNWYVGNDRSDAETRRTVFGLPCRFPATPSILGECRVQVYEITRFSGTVGSPKKILP